MNCYLSVQLRKASKAIEGYDKSVKEFFDEGKF